MTKYPPEILRLMNHEGFNQAFEEELPKHETQFDAYMAVEERREKYFDKAYYSDFQSFRNTRYKLLSKKRKNAK